MIQSVIIDDEQNSRDFLEKMIDRYLPEKLQVSAKVGTIGEAMDVITDKCPDLVFLDIHLKDQSGLELLYHYKDANLKHVHYELYIHSPLLHMEAILCQRDQVQHRFVCPWTLGHHIATAATSSPVKRFFISL